MQDLLVRFRFPAVVIFIVLSIWGLFILAQIRADAARGEYPALDPELHRRSLEITHSAARPGN